MRVSNCMKDIVQKILFWKYLNDFRSTWNFPISQTYLIACVIISASYYWLPCTLGWKMNPGSKPLSVQHSSGQKLIPVCKVSAGNWIRGQTPDRFSTNPVENGSRYSGTGRKPDPGSLNYKGSGRKLIPVLGYRPKTWSGVSELQRFLSKMDSGIRVPAENQIRGLWTTKVPVENWSRY